MSDWIKSFDKCPTCGEWCFLRSHTCPPRWEVAMADDPEDTRTIHAYDAEAAAEEFAGRWDDGTLSADGGEIEVIVRSTTDPDDEGQHFVVTGEMVPQYTVEEAGGRGWTSPGGDWRQVK